MKYVFLHGWSFSPEIFEQFKVQGSRFKVFCPDLYALNSPLTFKNIAAQLNMELRTLNTELVIIGWSMGGSIALELLHYTDLPIKGLVLVSSTPKFLNIVQSSKFEVQGSRLEQEDSSNLELRTLNLEPYNGGLSLALARNLRQRLLKDPEETYRYFRDLVCQTANHQSPITNYQLSEEAALQTLDELYKADYRPILGDIKVPTLIIHGQNDPICPVQAAEYMYDHIQESELCIIDKAGHIPFLEYPVKFQRVLKSFAV